MNSRCLAPLVTILPLVFGCGSADTVTDLPEQPPAEEQLILEICGCAFYECGPRTVCNQTVFCGECEEGLVCKYDPTVGAGGRNVCVPPCHHC